MLLCLKQPWIQQWQPRPQNLGATRSDVSALLLETIRGRVGTGVKEGSGLWTVFLAGGIKGPCHEVGCFSQTTEKGCPGMECQQTSSRTNAEWSLKRGSLGNLPQSLFPWIPGRGGPAILLRWGILGGSLVDMEAGDTHWRWSSGPGGGSALVSLLSVWPSSYRTSWRPCS